MTIVYTEFDPHLNIYVCNLFKPFLFFFFLLLIATLCFVTLAIHLIYKKNMWLRMLDCVPHQACAADINSVYRIVLNLETACCCHVFNNVLGDIWMIRCKFRKWTRTHILGFMTLHFFLENFFLITI